MVMVHSEDLLSQMNASNLTVRSLPPTSCDFGEDTPTNVMFGHTQSCFQGYTSTSCGAKWLMFLPHPTSTGLIFPTLLMAEPTNQHDPWSEANFEARQIWTLLMIYPDQYLLVKYWTESHAWLQIPDLRYRLIYKWHGCKRSLSASTMVYQISPIKVALSKHSTCFNPESLYIKWS